MNEGDRRVRRREGWRRRRPARDSCRGNRTRLATKRNLDENRRGGAGSAQSSPPGGYPGRRRGVLPSFSRRAAGIGAMAASSVSFGSRASCRRVGTVVSRGEGGRIDEGRLCGFSHSLASLAGKCPADPRPVCL